MAEEGEQSENSNERGSKGILCHRTLRKQGDDGDDLRGKS